MTIQACEKCGAWDIYMRYHKPSPAVVFENRCQESRHLDPCDGGKGEHLQLICRRCGYRWTRECGPL